MRTARIIIDSIDGGILMLKKGLAVLAIVAVLGMPAVAFAQETEGDKQRQAAQNTAAKANLGLALGLGLAIAAFGGALGQSNAIGKAVDAVARQPEAGARIQGMMIIGLALIETLVIYMLLICFMWGGKLGTSSDESASPGVRRRSTRRPRNQFRGRRHAGGDLRDHLPAAGPHSVRTGPRPPPAARSGDQEGP
jgi:F-type H+-transporting ATPase subunit c